jgi:hypothetical protein
MFSVFTIVAFVGWTLVLVGVIISAMRNVPKRVHIAGLIFYGVGGYLGILYGAIGGLIHAPTMKNIGNMVDIEFFICLIGFVIYRYNFLPKVK